MELLTPMKAIVMFPHYELIAVPVAQELPGGTLFNRSPFLNPV